MMRYKPLETAPLVSPIEIAELRKHCDVEGFTDDDAQLTELAQSAFDYLHGTSGILGRSLVDSEWKQKFDCFEQISFGIGPVTSITSIAYIDADGIEQTVPEADYSHMQTMDGKGGVYCLSADGWPTLSENPASVEVTFQAGTDDLPTPLRSAIKMHTLAMYDPARSGSGAGSDAYNRLIKGFSLMGV